MDSLINDFAQLACGSFSSSVVRVLRMWFVFWSAIRVFLFGSVLVECLECSSCEIECTVRLYNTTPICDCQFKCEYSRI